MKLKWSIWMPLFVGLRLYYLGVIFVFTSQALPTVGYAHVIGVSMLGAAGLICCHEGFSAWQLNRQDSEDDVNQSRYASRVWWLVALVLSIAWLLLLM